MTEFIKKFVTLFLIIYTGITIIFAFLSGNEGSIYVVSIWRIMLLAALTALVTAAVFSIEPKKPLRIPMIAVIFLCHFLILCVIVFFGGTSFGWFETSANDFLQVVFSVAFVYVFTTVISVILTHKETNVLNSALKNYKEE
jgi:uncharacterized membrane protein